MSIPMRRSPDSPPDGAARADTDLPPAGAAPSPPETEAAPSPMPAIAGLWLGRARRWWGILAAFFTAQALVQAAAFASGLLLVRGLAVDDYAFYTLATSAFTFLAFASNLGATSAFAWFFRESKGDAVARARHDRAVVEVRRRLFFGAAPIAVGILLATALGRGFGGTAIAVAAVLVAATAWVAIDGVAAVQILRLNDRYAASYRAEVAAALARLALIAALVALGFASALTALAAALAGQLAMVALAHGARARRVAGPALAPERRAVFRFLAPTLPAEVYAAFQGPLLIWLAALLGSTRGVAEIGALGRLGQLMALLSTLAGVVFLPRLSRIADDRLYRQRFFAFAAFLAAIAGATVGAAWIVRGPLLALLGPGYVGLERELLLTVGAAAVYVPASFAIWVNAARSWKRWQVHLTVALILFQVGWIVLSPLESTADFLRFGLANAVVVLVLQLGNALVGLFRPRAVAW